MVNLLCRFLVDSRVLQDCKSCKILRGKREEREDT